MQKFLSKSLLLAALAGLLIPATDARAEDAVTRGVAKLQPTEGSNVTGLITFEKTGDGMHVSGKIEGLTPGKHGFHIHDFGDITSADGKAAGGHFNPTGAPHAGMDTEMRHVGDMGNVEADADGVANVDVTNAGLSFEGKTSILGRGLVVHAGTDDLKTQPSGDAGARAAVAVIGVAGPK